MVIHKLGSDASVCQTFSTEFEAETSVPLHWMGESLATMLFRAFETTTKPPRTRKQLTDEERQSLWEAQASVCKLCGAEAAKEHLEVDHVEPLCVGGGDTLDNLQILCKTCHAQKTQLETLSFVEESNPLLSRFSIETSKAFVQSPKPPLSWLQISMKEREERSQSTLEGLATTPSLRLTPTTSPLFLQWTRLCPQCRASPAT